MTWMTPVLVEICIGLKINGYMPADGYVPVCTENLGPDVMVMKSTKNRV